jgi:crotonobetainyl-CoA:carnitine CoA-transferase CaiB-like acyl-CoA transferase
MAPPFALSETPARADRAGPTLGEHNEEVFKGLLGLSADEYASLAADGVFA